MRRSILISSAVIVCLLIACSDKDKYGGDSMINYPDLNLIMKDYLQQYQKSPYTFLRVETRKKKRDSTFLSAEKVDWKEVNTLFEKANLYQKQLDKQYTITVISDTLNPTMTLLYTSINPKNLVTKLSINAENTDNKIQSIYWETRDEGFFNSKEKKVLYVVGKTIQIQEYSKDAFSSGKKKIIQYVFLN